MSNLGGHDLPSLLEAFEKAREHDRPVCFIAYTIKGFGLPLAGHKDNHAGLLTPDADGGFRSRRKACARAMNGTSSRARGCPQAEIEHFLAEVPFIQQGHAPLCGAAGAGAGDARRSRPIRRMSTQQGFGLILNELARSDQALADRIVTTAPDVTVSTNLGAWVNRRGLFARESLADTFKKERIPSTYNWEFSPRRPAYRARHRRDEPVHPALGARPLAFALRRAAPADRHALRPVHLSRRRCAELCLLSGCPLHDRRHAVRRDAGAGGRRAPVHRHAADRHGAGRARLLRAGLRRRARRDHALGLRLHAARRRGRAGREDLAARRDRRLGLSAPLDPQPRAAAARR